MNDTGKPFDVRSAIAILSDIVTALADLDGKVVHRDLKPENVLLLEGKWCLADFGISRYAAATTAPDTQKYALSPPYAAPERWRNERAAGAADIYSLGVVAFELLNKALPFSGLNVEDFRDQHLHGEPGTISNVPPLLASLVSECLYKSPGARPGPQNVLARLKAVAECAEPSSGLALLQAANMVEVARQSETARKEVAGQSQAQRRDDLLRDAFSSFRQIGEELKLTIVENAPAAELKSAKDGGWSVRLNQASLALSSGAPALLQPGGGRLPIRLDVIAFASISVRIPTNRYDYEGRSHSLWFCDAAEIGRYGWFETAFMFNPMMGRHSSVAPFAAQPGEEIAEQALGPGQGTHQLAWPFTPLILSDLGDFVSRWASWLAQGAQDRLNFPSTMPERPALWLR
jgi:eukaryotic-like serine/threonine-protein kinase